MEGQPIPSGSPIPTRRRTALRFVLALGAISVLYSPAWLAWGRFCAHSYLYSFALLIPAVSAYLCFLRRRDIGNAAAVSSPAPVAGAAFVLLGAAVAIVAALPAGASGRPEQDALSGLMAACVTSVLGAVVFAGGWPLLKAALFPALLLYLMAPLPVAAEAWFAAVLQRGSAASAWLLLQASGTPSFRDGLVFYLPGLTLLVADECSGIHSTLVLFVTALVGGRLLLRKAWKIALLSALVLPLGMLRNGLRIVTIGLLTVHVDRGIIEGPLHHRGGPIFFALSLIPLLLVLLWMRKTDVPGPLFARKHGGNDHADP